MTFGICFKQKFDTRYLVFYNPSPPSMFLSLDLLSEYRIQHGAIGPLYVTSSYSNGIFCRGVSGFATDCPSDVWCRGLTTCLLHVGSPFGNRFLNTSWAVGLIYWIVYLHFFFFFVFWHMQLYMLQYIISFLALSLLLKYSLLLRLCRSFCGCPQCGAAPYRDCFLDIRLFNSPNLRRLGLCYCCQAWTLETVLGGNTALMRCWTASSIDADAKR